MVIGSRMNEGSLVQVGEPDRLFDGAKCLRRDVFSAPR